MKTTPKALTSVGRMTAWSWFTQLELRHEHEERDDAELGGTIIVATDER